ncbi:MAG: TIGR02530 family flagellar biosynthesis protein [Fidelibacterota bacterium]
MKISDLQFNRNLQNIDATRKHQNIPQSNSFKPAEKNEHRKNFAEVLGNQLQPQKEIVFSAHAKRRITDRNITVDLERLESGIEQVNKKGSNNSLVMIDKDAFIVNVKNKTVITAVDQQSMQNNVFTNIDSVAIV